SSWFLLARSLSRFLALPPLPPFPSFRRPPPRGLDAAAPPAPHDDEPPAPEAADVPPLFVAALRNGWHRSDRRSTWSPSPASIARSTGAKSLWSTVVPREVSPLEGEAPATAAAAEPNRGCCWYFCAVVEGEFGATGDEAADPAAAAAAAPPAPSGDKGEGLDQPSRSMTAALTLAKSSWLK
ncbi:unnamed protein product, partial [Ectocarpus sp. 12 AP-2014]